MPGPNPFAAMGAIIITSMTTKPESEDEPPPHGGEDLLHGIRCRHVYAADGTCMKCGQSAR